MPLFPDLGPVAKPPANYEEYWNSLRRAKKYEYLHSHQLKVLEAFQGCKGRDVAICLPTGTGKTVVGLVMAGFEQRVKPQLVLYLCPTVQLAKQVLAEAKTLGVPAVPLYGNWDQVTQEAKDRYNNGAAIGVAAYATLFNSSPKPQAPNLIIFDDVHAGGEAVLSPWRLVVRKEEHPDVFDALVSVLMTQLPPDQVAVCGPSPPPERQVDMVRARDWLMVVDSVEAVLKQRADGTSLYHPWKRLQGKLAGAFCFLSANIIEIRPWVAPTFQLKPFDARRRVYLSATLDRWGHLEHLMGLEGAERIQHLTVQVPGRRLVLNLNRLLPSMNDMDRVVHMATRTSSALVLCRSTRDRDEVLNALSKAGYQGPMLGRDPDADIEKFRRECKGVLVLANRYDGLDLGDGLCSNIVIWKLPRAIGSQEDFTTELWRMRDAADARARQRIQQGMGRCTRRESDSAVVGFVGEDLVGFMVKPAVGAALPKRLRAEVGVCSELKNPADFDGYVNACLSGSAEWERLCATVDARASTFSEEAQPDEELMQTHRREAGYNMHLWSGDYGAAAAVATKCAQKFAEKRAEEDAAIWFYLASVAEDLAAFHGTGSPYSVRGGEHLNEARQRAHGRWWFAQLDAGKPFAGDGVSKEQVEGVVRFFNRYPKQTEQLDQVLQQALDDLRQTEHTRYHRGLRTLGESLGLEAHSPTWKGAPDVVWSLVAKAAAIFEAKTEKNHTSPLGVNEVRQLISQPRETRANEKLDVPVDLLSVCVTDALTVAKEEAHSLSGFQVVRPADVLRFAELWFDRVSVLHKRAPQGSLDMARALVGSALRQLGATPEALPGALSIIPADEALEPEK